MGTGDWNDGMNLVGADGRGESVWLGLVPGLAFFEPFAPLAEARGDSDARANATGRHARRLRERARRTRGTAHWYRRAYFDDGTPLGSQANEECRIDAIAQSWAVDLRRRRSARARARRWSRSEQQLVARGRRMVLLLTPPFDRMEPSPGYIQGYVPGVRENGGQIHPRRALDRAGVRAARRRRPRDGAVRDCSTRSTTRRNARRAVAATAPSPTWSPPTSIRVPPHTGRGGWTWYTGSAGWMYRVGDRIDARPAPANRRCSRSLHPAALAGVRGDHQARRRRAGTSSSRTPPASAGECGTSSSTASSRPRPLSR